MPIKHAFVSAKSDGGDATLVRPGDWNADHVGSFYPLDSYAIDGTYGDDFNTASLSGIWTRRNFVSGDETYQPDINGTYIRLAAYNRSAGDGYFQTAPAGDWTFAMKSIERGGSCIGIACVDTNGTGVAIISVYGGPPIAPLLTRITTYSTYQGTYVQTHFSGTNPNTKQWEGRWHLDRVMWTKLRKSGTNYYFSYSLDGETWFVESGALAATFTVDRVGFIFHPLGGGFGSGTLQWDIDWFNKIA